MKSASVVWRGNRFEVTQKRDQVSGEISSHSGSKGMARNMVGLVWSACTSSSIVQARPGPCMCATRRIISQILIFETVSKVTLDIICDTAFGYRTDSLHNPHNELAEAYEDLLSLQSGKCYCTTQRKTSHIYEGPNMARFSLIMSLPGGAKFLASKWAYEHRSLFRFLGPVFCEIPIELWFSN